MEYKKIFNTALNISLGISSICVAICWLFFWNIGEFLKIKDFNDFYLFFYIFLFGFIYLIAHVFIGFFLDKIYSQINKPRPFFFKCFMFFSSLFLVLLFVLYNNGILLGEEMPNIGFCPIILSLAISLILSGLLISLIISFLGILFGYAIKKFLIKSKI